MFFIIKFKIATHFLVHHNKFTDPCYLWEIVAEALFEAGLKACALLILGKADERSG